MQLSLKGKEIKDCGSDIYPNCLSHGTGMRGCSLKAICKGKLETHKGFFFFFLPCEMGQWSSLTADMAESKFCDAQTEVKYQGED